MGSFKRWIKRNYIGKRGKELKSIGHSGMTKIEHQQKESLLVRIDNTYQYLRQDVDKGVSMKAILLKATRPDKVNMPFEHLTYSRIDKIL